MVGLFCRQFLCRQIFDGYFFLIDRSICRSFHFATAGNHAIAIFYTVATNVCAIRSCNYHSNIICCLPAERAAFIFLWHYYLPFFLSFRLSTTSSTNP